MDGRNLEARSGFPFLRILNDCKSFDTYCARFEIYTEIGIDVIGDKFRHCRQTLQYIRTETIFLYCCSKSVFVLEEVNDR